MHKYNLHIKRDLFDAMMDVAKAKEMSFAQLVRRLISAYLKNPEKFDAELF